MKKVVFFKFSLHFIFFAFWSVRVFACDDGFFRVSVIAPIIVLAAAIIGFYLYRRFVRKIIRPQVTLICLLTLIVGLYFTLPSALKDLISKCETAPINLDSFDP